MRAKWKGVYRIAIEDNKAPTITHRRGDTIIPADVGDTVRVSDGKTERVIRIVEGHINHKFGELTITKKTPKYKAKATPTSKKKGQ